MGSQSTFIICALVCYLVVAASAFPEKKNKRESAFKLRKNIKQFIEKQKHRCIGMMMNKGMKRHRAEKRCIGGYGYGFPGGFGGYGYGGFPAGCDMMPGDWFGWGYPGFGGGYGGFPGGWGGGYPGGFGGGYGGYGGRGGGCGCGGGCGGCCGGNCCGGFECPHWCCCGKDEGASGEGGGEEGGEGEGGGEAGGEPGGEAGGEPGGDAGGEPGGDAGGENGGGTEGEDATAQDKPMGKEKSAGQVSVQIKQVNPAPAGNTIPAARPV